MSNIGINKLLEDYYLINLVVVGLKFTWSNEQSGNGLIREMLNKAFCNMEWRSVFPIDGLAFS